MGRAGVAAEAAGCGYGSRAPPPPLDSSDAVWHRLTSGSRGHRGQPPPALLQLIRTSDATAVRTSVLTIDRLVSTIVVMVVSLEDGRMWPDDPEEIAEFVKRAAAGERAAWDALVRRFNGLIWAIVRQYWLSPADSQDVTQVVWLRLLENLGSLRDPSRVGGWLATTTRRECLRLIRLGHRMVPVTDNLLESKSNPGASPEDIVAASDHQRTVFEVVGMLEPRCQQLLELSAYELPYQAISELLDMPVGSIGPTRGRCLERLRELLRAAGINPDAGDS